MARPPRSSHFLSCCGCFVARHRDKGLRKLARRIKPKVHPTSDSVEESTKEDLGKKPPWPNTSRVAPEPCGGDALEEDIDPIKGDSAGGTPLAMVTPSTITSESDVTDDGAVWSWLYQRIPEEEGLPPDKGTGASGECDALEEALDPIKGDSAGGTPLAMGTGASGECDALEEALDPIKGDSAGGTPLALVTPSTITSESDVTDDGAVWSWLYQRIPEEEGLPPDKGTGASGECDALEEALDPIKGDSAGGTPLAMGTGASGECDALEEALDPIKGDSAGGTPLALVTPSTITSESDVTDDGAVWSWLYQRIPEEEGLPPDKGTGASGECDALEEALDPIKGDSAGGTPLAMGTGASGECDALEEALDPIKGDSAGGTPLALVTPSTITSESDVTDDGAVWSWLYQRIPEEEGLPPDKGTGASGECDALEEALDPIKGDSAGGTPLALGTGASGECDQAMTMATVVRKEDDFAGCEASDP
ncbi:uncharacterized protein LOC125282233 isoform X1 [Ursus arctos]|uniref:uncharacterized protein LOC125282233 isoform X1 n=1 Tax=Ursus arctos TaxID=9644 RepID=UPI0025470E62|nr:uncharacterized protein LOC125282233 isoform X1 [Ursus arctos]